MPPSFIGSDACGRCHQPEFKLWTSSHHQLAMQPATAAAVLGNFNESFNGTVRSTFFKRDNHFMVRTDGPDGALHDYTISFTFGVFPLQQYLIAMPGGRLQALGIAWDSRPRDRGGQRWFFLYPGQILHGSDPLHWTGIDQTWNYMCADCHSTNLRKNFDLTTRSYKTTYAEVSVGCEACHGPGSNHLAWAEKTGDWKRLAGKGLTIALDENTNATWAIDPTTGEPQRTPARMTEREIQMCARCHSRRGQINEDYVHGQPVGDDYRVALLAGDLYFPDGQIKGEVYEYGSFIQSRMYHAGVTCSDCHEPHSLKLRAEGNQVCLQCHAAKYDSPQHHFHQAGSGGAQCVNCHMPTRTYMVIDVRRDHSLRVPRPDLSVQLGIPNACNQCHGDKSAQWALDRITKWYGHGPTGFQHFAESLDHGAEGAPDATRELEALIANREQPAIARATALALLATTDSSPARSAVAAGARDDSPLVRRSAAHALSAADLGAEGPTIAGLLLNDPVRAVRIETAELLAGTQVAAATSGLATLLARATGEYVAAQESNADRPDAHLKLGLLYARAGNPPRAEDELKIALSLDPAFAPAAVNLADLYRELGREAEAQAVLRSALHRSPDDASLLHALGLSMIRAHQIAQALDLLAAASRRDPANARYAYVYAVALNDTGSSAAAIKVLETSIARHPYDRESLIALVDFLKQSGNPAAAPGYAERLNELDLDRPDRRKVN